MSLMASASLQLPAPSDTVGVVLYSAAGILSTGTFIYLYMRSNARARFDAYTEGARSADCTESWSGGLARVTSSTSCASLERTWNGCLTRETEDALHSQSYFSTANLPQPGGRVLWGKRVAWSSVEMGSFDHLMIRLNIILLALLALSWTTVVRAPQSKASRQGELSYGLLELVQVVTEIWWWKYGRPLL
ncbi:hypothetical protein C8Q74DRAFT_981170 [Fomes fomentarius]|nr:hypothetical protein C8Q74DRAFT_981170 [Fomes fomentarius]